MTRICMFLLAMLAPVVLLAHNHLCSGQKEVKSTARVTSVSPEEDYYDVQYLRFNLKMGNMSTAISGAVTTRARVQVGSMPVYTFELNNQLSIDSLKFNGVLLPVSGTGSIRTVTLPAALTMGDVFDAQVFYHGAPTTGTGFFTRGLNYIRLSSGTNLLYTMSDRFTAEDWWPCKQNLQDKIDSADIWITVPDSLKAGSNGLLTGVTSLPGGMARYEWKTRYAIDYYLLSVCVAPYSDYSYFMHFSDGSGDSMLVQNYVYDSLSYMTADRKAALDSTGLIIDHFSTLFGRYPFYKEKYGHCIVEPLGGGMEHQTMTTLAYAQGKLIAHELGHQWWGDHVTYGAWSDIWLSEGFASYCEQLFIEHFQTASDLLGYRNAVFNRVITGIGTTAGSVYVYDTVSTARVFSSRLTYDKGAAVAHMLRYVAPHDSLYFKVLRTFQQDFAFKNAFTSDLQQVAEAVYGFDLDTFFTQWVYKEGYPIYSARWYQDGTRLLLEVSQTTSAPASVARFATPLQIKLKSVAGDTTLTVYHNLSKQSYEWTIINPVSSIQIDPENHILNKEGVISNDPSLSIGTPVLNKLVIAPNPATEGWSLSNVPPGANLQLTDIHGRILWRAAANGNSIWLPGNALASGHYVLNVHVAGKAQQNYQLEKQ